jgi:hypothetical protein
VVLASQRAIDQHVEPAELRRNLLVQGVERLEVFQIKNQPVDIMSQPPHLGRERVVGLARSRSRDDRGSGFGQRSRYAAAKQRPDRRP